MPSLFSYCVPSDSGRAPNPFWSVCTLVICKPPIRRKAEVGDWIVGTGSKNARCGDMSGKVVYIMEVTKKIRMAAYDALTRESLPEKIPDWHSADPRRKVGDSIYDFTSGSPVLRKGVRVHATAKLRQRDLRGEYALLSEHFWYFGNRAVPLPPELMELVQQRQGFKRPSIQHLLAPFLEWVTGLGLAPNRLYGKPQAWRHSRACPDECSPT